MASTHHYSIDFIADNDAFVFAAIDYPPGFNPIVPAIGSQMMTNDIANRVVTAQLETVSFSFHKAYTLMLFGLSNCRFSVAR